MNIPYGERVRITSFTASQYDYPEPDPVYGRRSFLLLEADIKDWNEATLIVDGGNATHLSLKAYRKTDPFSGKPPYVSVARCDLTTVKAPAPKQETYSEPHTPTYKPVPTWVQHRWDEQNTPDLSSDSYPGMGSYYNS